MKQEAIVRLQKYDSDVDNVTKFGYYTKLIGDAENDRWEVDKEFDLTDPRGETIIKFPKKAHSFFIKNNTPYYYKFFIFNEKDIRKVRNLDKKSPIPFFDHGSGIIIAPYTAEEVYVSKDNDSETFKDAIQIVYAFLNDNTPEKLEFGDTDFIEIQGEDIYVEESDFPTKTE